MRTVEIYYSTSILNHEKLGLPTSHVKFPEGHACWWIVWHKRLISCGKEPLPKQKRPDQHANMRWLDSMGQNSIGKHGFKHGFYGSNMDSKLDSNILWRQCDWIQTNVQIGSHCITRACHGAMSTVVRTARRFLQFGKFRLAVLDTSALGGQGFFFAGKWGCRDVPNCCVPDRKLLWNRNWLYKLYSCIFYMVYYGLPRRHILDS